MLAVTGYQEHKFSGDEFSRFHPLVNFIYFAFVFLFSMTLTHPASQIISLVCAVFCGISVCGFKGAVFCLKYSLPLMLITAVINPAFSHAGMTILAYLPTGNPLTLESILYGISSGTMLASVLIWFMCFNSVITSDKFIYLFGKIIPSLSLMLSMTLRFIPKFKAQFEVVSEAQKCLGRDISQGSILRRMKNAVKILSIVVTWSLENAIETADSMKSRGYGLKGRTAFSIYRIDEHDRNMIVWIIFCGIYVLCGSMAGAFQWQYFPRIYGVDSSCFIISFHAVYFMLCITPVIINRKENHRWKSMQSEI